jgi:hypothetical protein
VDNSQQLQGMQQAVGHCRIVHRIGRRIASVDKHGYALATAVVGGISSSIGGNGGIADSKSCQE